MTENSQILCDRILLAYKLKQERIKQNLPTLSYLYDPIEDDYQYAEIIKEVKQKIDILISDRNQQRIDKLEEKDKYLSRIIIMSSIYKSAAITKKHLFKKYNIQWFSIIEMNPGIIFN